MEYYNYVKALHLIFVITWFAGLFYTPRLLIYHMEAASAPEPDRSILVAQLKLMTRRLWYIITWPSAILAVIFAMILLILAPEWLSQSWMQVKLAFVGLLLIYHYRTHVIVNRMQADVIGHTPMFMRFWNEVATLVLFAIVFLVVLRNAMDWVYGLAGLVVLGMLLMLGVRWYRRFRERNPQ